MKALQGYFYIALVARLGLIAAGHGIGQAGNPEDKVTKAQARIEVRLKELSARFGTVVPIKDDELGRLFPSHTFFAVRFRMYPVAMAAPEPLQSRNLLIAPKEGPLIQLNTPKQVESFFRANLKPLEKEAAQRDAVRGWLRLSEELTQDGFFKFITQEDSLKVEDGKATGKTIVTSGGKGEITVALGFDRAGKLTSIQHKSTVMPGVRPICQATKLLDPDPIVRRMAEQDILVMGRAAHDYLMDQRAKAGPRLQKAIDRIWNRILREGWS